MSKLIAVLSPAKLLDDKTHYPQLKCSQPQFIEEATIIANKLKKLKGIQFEELMKISTKLAQETQLQFAHWQTPFTHSNAHPALHMFKGEVYRGLDAAHFNPSEIEFAQRHLRILSGLYGLLNPLDFVMPYRLMMGTSFAPSAKIKNLYDFWSAKITAQLKSDLHPEDTLLNLASSEYFRVISLPNLERNILTCEFKEQKGSEFVTSATYSKLARGKMARFLIVNRIENSNDLKAFDADGYRFNAKLSRPQHFLFSRS